MKMPLPLALLFLSAVGGLAAAVQYEPPPVVLPDEAKLKEIEARTDKLKNELAEMRKKEIRDPAFADVEVCLKAAQWITKYKEFYTKDAGDWTLAVLDHGLLRARQALRGETPWLYKVGFSIPRGYHSAIDGSVQPYAVTFPADFGKEAAKKWRLDIVLHGRSKGLTEVGFLSQHDNPKPAPKDMDYIQIDIYGRGNNGYRWAGEMDVIEVMEHFLATERILNRDQSVDLNRVVLRGFSMGGAGTWHIGLHRPDLWAVIGPGAGFTTTKGYVPKFPEPLTPTQEATLRIYDAVDYAENVFDVPVVAYDGAEDKQLQAAHNIEAAIKKTGLKMPFALLVAPGLEHKFPPEWQKKAEEEYQKYLKKGRNEYPSEVRFVTYTLKYPTCYWIELFALDKHYERTLIDAKQLVDARHVPIGYEVKTTNVRVFKIQLPPSADRGLVKVTVDGQELEAKPSQVGRDHGLNVFLEKRDGRWNAILPERYATARLRTLQKSPNLQGPIDDAFMTSFLIVRGTGQPWHEGTKAYTDATMQRFADEWKKYFRGDLQSAQPYDRPTLPLLRDDVDVRPEDLATRNLILFGDPVSNSLIAQVMPGLPFQWTKDKIAWEGKDYAASDHVPVLIYPSPLNADRYVVINSGHTFHAADLQGSNALLYPRLGDHALLKLNSTKKDPLAVETVRSGLFDDYWRFTTKP